MMNKYMVIRKQQGDGCDYTIGCGINFYFIEANSIMDVYDLVLWPDGKGEASAIDGDWNPLGELHIIPFEYVESFDLGALRAIVDEASNE